MNFGGCLPNEIARTTDFGYCRLTGIVRTTHFGYCLPEINRNCPNNTFQKLAINSNCADNGVTGFKQLKLAATATSDLVSRMQYIVAPYQYHRIGNCTIHNDFTIRQSASSYIPSPRNFQIPAHRGAISRGRVGCSKYQRRRQHVHLQAQVMPHIVLFYYITRRASSPG